MSGITGLGNYDYSAMVDAAKGNGKPLTNYNMTSSSYINERGHKKRRGVRGLIQNIFGKNRSKSRRNEPRQSGFLSNLGDDVQDYVNNLFSRIHLPQFETQVGVNNSTWVWILAILAGAWFMFKKK